MGAGKQLNDFWQAVDRAEAGRLGPGLSRGVGCYVFWAGRGREARPWYVGKTEDQTFRDECFQDHKRAHCGAILRATAAGPLFLQFYPKLSRGKVFVQPRMDRVAGRKYVGFLERYMILEAIKRNPGLLNTRDTTIFGNIRLDGKRLAGSRLFGAFRR